MKRLTQILFLIGCMIGMLPLAGCGGRNGAVTVAKGIAKLEAGDYAAAARAFSRATRRIKDSAPLYYNLGTAYFHMGKYDAAASAFEAALRIDSGHLLSLELLAQTHIRQKAFEPAIPILRSLSQRAAREDRPRLLNALAIAERGAGSIDLACLHLVQAARLAPRYAPTYYNLGNLLHDEFQLFTEATDQLELFIRLAPSEDPHVEKASETLRRLKASGANLPGKRPGRDGATRNSAAALQAIREGDVLYKARQWARAETCFAQALTADSLNYDAAIRLGYARTGAGNLPEAIKAYQRAGEISPDKIEPIFLQAHTAYASRNYAQAAQLLTTIAIPRWPTYAASYHLMACVRAAQQRIPDAILYGQYYLELASPKTEGYNEFRAWLNNLPQKSQ